MLTEVSAKFQGEGERKRMLDFFRIKDCLLAVLARLIWIA
jgi:hypothetical protein